MKDPCKKYVKEADKKTSLFSRDYWTGALLYIQAAECYKSSGNYEQAFKYAMKAADALKKYASKYGYELVIKDIEKALLIAYSVSKEDKREEVKREIFSIMNLRAKQMEMSGNYLGAAETYRRSIEFAPSGQDALNTLMHASNLLERVIEQKAKMGKDQLVDKLMAKLEEIKSLIPMVETTIMGKTEKIPSLKPQAEATIRAIFQHVDILSEVVRKLAEAIQALPISQISQSETIRGYEINFVFPSGEIHGKISLEGGKIIFDLKGKDPIMVHKYYRDLREIILDNVESCKIIDQKLEGLNTLDILIELLNIAMNKTLARRSYREILIEIRNAMRILTNLASEKKFKNIIKKLELVESLLKKVPDEDASIEDRKAAKISEYLEEASNELRKYV